MSTEQQYRNHTRFDPPVHFFVTPVLLINVLVALGVLVHRWPVDNLLHGWIVVVSIALLVSVPAARMAALRAQDRLIRLEQMLRFTRVLGPAEMPLVEHLSLRQIIALRFAADTELAALVRRASAEGMSPKAIKEAVQHWQADTVRV